MDINISHLIGSLNYFTVINLFHKSPGELAKLQNVIHGRGR